MVALGGGGLFLMSEVPLYRRRQKRASLVPPDVPFSGDTTPCRMTGVTFHTFGTAGDRNEAAGDIKPRAMGV